MVSPSIGWGGARGELLDHVIALNERHLKRLLAEYVSYHHEDRTHLGLGKETPGCRTRCVTSGRVLPMTDWAGCTTVMIGRPSPKTFPSILNNMYVCAAVDGWTPWERSGWDKGTCAPSNGSLGQMQAQSFRLGEKEGRHSRRITFRRATGIWERNDFSF
jgi:hypothetical protein